MNLRIKIICVFIYLYLLIAFLSFGVWKLLELDKCLKMKIVLESQWKDSEQMWIENLKLSSQIYGNYVKNKDFIQEIIGNKTSVLIYRYSKYMCEGCIQEDLQEIEFLQEEIGKDKILLIPAYPDNREERIELTNVLAKFNYVNNTSIDSFLIPSEEGYYLQRYFAVIDKEGNLTMVFFPRRGEKNLTRIYFSEAKKNIVIFSTKKIHILYRKFIKILFICIHIF